MVDRFKAPAGSLLEELASALRIDENALNDVCREHPTVFYRIAREMALAVSRRDAAKAGVERLELEMGLDLRERARDDGDKITVDEIKARVRETPKYVEAVDRLAAESFLVGQWSALKEAFQQRSYALNHMVDLYLANYYGNIERRESSDERTRDANEARDRMVEMRRANPEQSGQIRSRETPSRR